MGEFDYASGNHNFGGKVTNTFDQLYASNHGKFGLVDQFWFAESRASAREPRSQPIQKFYCPGLKASILAWPAGWTMSYKADGTVLAMAPPVGYQGSVLGNGIDLSATYVYRDYLLFEAGVGHLFPGTVLTQSANRSPLTLSYLQISYRFGVSKTGTLTKPD